MIDAGLTWIGPSPDAIIALGDKVQARHIAMKAGAPLVPGTKEPVKDADEVVAFAEEHGLPVAIKAAFGGGGRGLKVARTIEEIPELFDSAVREAVSAFGRGECFVERFLDKPRHVEAQVLADTHGNVIVVGTRDCSLQRRNQKLVEEAPAPFLTDEQRARIHESAKAICAEAGYHGAGTVEYLVGADGSISFLEVNTRLQVEHPVSRGDVAASTWSASSSASPTAMQLEITEDPEPRGHSIEFRINAEDAGRNFMPAPGPVHAPGDPAGPRRALGLRRRDRRRGRRRVRLDAGQADRHRRHPRGGAAARPPGAGRADRRGHAHGHPVPPRRRPRRGVHQRAVHRAHALDRDRVGQPGPALRRRPGRARGGGAPADRRRRGRRPPARGLAAGRAGRRRRRRSGAAAKPRKRGGGGGGSAASGDSLTSPMQGTIVKVAVEDGATVEAGDLIVVLEAMKMEQPITAHKAGTVSGLSAEVGAAVTSGAVICTIADAAE